MAPVAASPNPVAPPLPPISAAKDKVATRKRFEAVYTVVRDDLLADFRKHNMPEEVVDYYRRVRIPIVVPFAQWSKPFHRAWTTTYPVASLIED